MNANPVWERWHQEGHDPRLYRSDSKGMARTMPSGDRLEMTGSAPPAGMARDLFADPGRVTVLYFFQGSYPMDFPLDFSGYSDAFPNLRRVSMSGIGLERIEGLDGLHGVTQLDLSDNDIERIEGLGGLRSLEYLNLACNRITSTAGLADLPYPGRLRDLDIVANHVERLDGFEQLSGLRVLEAAENRIESMAPLAACTSLKEIWLGQNRITQVEGLGGMASLEVLDLQDNRITSLRGLGDIIAPHGTFKKIGIDGNPINIDELRTFWFSGTIHEHERRTGRSWLEFFDVLDEAEMEALTALDIDARCEEYEKRGLCKAKDQKKAQIATGKRWMPIDEPCWPCTIYKMLSNETIFRSFASMIHQSTGPNDPDLHPGPLVSFYRSRKP